MQNDEIIIEIKTLMIQSLLDMRWQESVAKI